ncbi:nucleotidyl transferase AbiEii/AbiGii toxin family protein [Acidithrix ferrooxidans]
MDTADVASIPDILAMKLNAVTGRAKLRDYFDLMVIDQQTGYPIEQGFYFFLERYRPQVPEQSAIIVVQSLGYLDDVVEDETVPVARQVVVDFWHNRTVEVARNLDRN